jgi:hypothetical protein
MKHMAACPIHIRDEIEEAALDRDIGDVAHHTWFARAIATPLSR